MTRIIDDDRLYFNELKYSIDIHCVCGAAVYIDNYMKDSTCKTCGRTYFIRLDVRYSEYSSMMRDERIGK